MICICGVGMWACVIDVHHTLAAFRRLMFGPGGPPRGGPVGKTSETHIVATIDNWHHHWTTGCWYVILQHMSCNMRAYCVVRLHDVDGEWLRINTYSNTNCFNTNAVVMSSSCSRFGPHPFTHYREWWLRAVWVFDACSVYRDMCCVVRASYIRDMWYVCLFPCGIEHSVSWIKFEAVLLHFDTLSPSCWL